MENNYAVLGIHDETPTVSGRVVRVRMFLGDKMVDEDFSTPKLITVEEQIDALVKDRIAEIGAKGTDPSDSKVVGKQVEQIVVEVPSE